MGKRRVRPFLAENASTFGRTWGSLVDLGDSECTKSVPETNLPIPIPYRHSIRATENSTTWEKQR